MFSQSVLQLHRTDSSTQAFLWLKSRSGIRRKNILCGIRNSQLCVWESSWRFYAVLQVSPVQAVDEHDNHRKGQETISLRILTMFSQISWDYHRVPQYSVYLHKFLCVVSVLSCLLVLCAGVLSSSSCSCHLPVLIRLISCLSCRFLWETVALYGLKCFYKKWCADSVLTDETKQVSFGVKQSLSFKILPF